MIEEVIAEIKEAENKAAQIIAEAKQSARDISLSAAGKSEQIRAKMTEETKAAVKAIMADAEKQADKASDHAKKEAEQSAKDKARAAEKNVRAVGEWLSDLLVKGKF